MSDTDICTVEGCKTILIVDDVDDNDNPCYANGFRCIGCTELVCYGHSDGLFCNACNEVP
jgi:hypothetical protein